MKNRADGLVLVSLYHLVVGVLSLLGSCTVVSLPVIVGIAAADSGNGGTAVMITGLMALLGAGLLLLIAAANIVVAWGLQRRLEWARLAALALAIISLLNVPLGTVAGGLIIWYLLQEPVKAEFVKE